MKTLWIAFIGVIIGSFAVLIWLGTEIYHEVPPLPTAVVTTDGKILINDGEVSNGQNVWQAMGGIQVGSQSGIYANRFDAGFRRHDFCRRSVCICVVCVKIDFYANKV
jgi:nitric oxide reductase large subunit